MDSYLQDLIKELLISVVLISIGLYLKIAKDKEPYSTKNTWKIIVAIGIIGLIISIVRFFTKT